MIAERFFKDGWIITRMVNISDSMGGFTQASSSQGTISGIMRPLSGELKLSASKDTVFGTHRFYCFPTTLLASGGYLSTGGAKYEVKFVADMMSMGRLMQCDCEVIE